MEYGIGSDSASNEHLYMSSEVGKSTKCHSISFIKMPLLSDCNPQVGMWGMPSNGLNERRDVSRRSPQIQPIDSPLLK
jgi:hypothetical protein